MSYNLNNTYIATTFFKNCLPECAKSILRYSFNLNMFLNKYQIETFRSNSPL